MEWKNVHTHTPHIKWNLFTIFNDDFTRKTAICSCKAIQNFEQIECLLIPFERIQFESQTSFPNANVSTGISVEKH